MQHFHLVNLLRSREIVVIIKESEPESSSFPQGPLGCLSRCFSGIAVCASAVLEMPDDVVGFRMLLYRECGMLQHRVYCKASCRTPHHALSTYSCTDTCFVGTALGDITLKPEIKLHSNRRMRSPEHISDVVEFPPSDIHPIWSCWT